MPEPKRVVIGYIDAQTRILVEDRFFLVEQRKRNLKKEIVWVGRHYFSHLADLLRYYLRLYLCREGKKDSDTESTLLRLLDKLTTLEVKIDEVGTRLQTEWEKTLERAANERTGQLSH